MAVDLQTKLAQSDRGRIMAMDSAYHVAPDNGDRDVVINASYCGVLPARFIARQRPRATIGLDCAVGPAGAAIAGLWYLEALNIPAAAADVSSVLMGNGLDLYENGKISFFNRPAADCGVCVDMSVKEAARLLLERDPASPNPEQVTNRTEVYRNDAGRAVFCLDSIAFGTPEDQRNVLVTAGDTGRGAIPYLLKIRPYGFICSDGGMGRDQSGIVGMHKAGEQGIPGATVDARTARMGDGRSSYYEGTISAANALAEEIGVHPGMSAIEAARLLADAEH